MPAQAQGRVPIPTPWACCLDAQRLLRDNAIKVLRVVRVETIHDGDLVLYVTEKKKAAHLVLRHEKGSTILGLPGAGWPVL